MNYSELLRSFISSSGLSLSKISLLLKERGFSTDKGYLSKLQNGKIPPAGEELNRAIAEITGGDPEELITVAYLEKAPDNIKQIFQYVNSDEYWDYNEGLAQRIINDPKTYKVMKEEMLKDVPDEYIDEFYKKTKTPVELNRLLLFPTSSDLGRAILNNKFKNQTKIKTHDVNAAIDRVRKAKKQLDSNVPINEMYPINNFTKVPLLGYISAGKPIFADEHIEEYVDIQNPWGYDPNNLFMLRVKGDSMIGSRIYDGDRVIVHLQPEVENGEIAIVNVNGYEATLKKVKKLESGQIILMPSNDKYEPIILENENARIIGKVIQVIFEP
ncbi:hypothetical protein KO561_05120 [Radiobacillus kanasensis]|uniref:LexA family protein n=1 Tax=Radiobacillus kanasensis TaxID=2844358 RepID=UPI001E4CAD1A|nr:LexA family transcriptional regulator [Radiobacillus kanasensis]UFU00333.1 hypothetical protein KO561_05120 [Radiobacillus kanasensis]